MNHYGTRRLDRHASARMVRRLGKHYGIDKRISPLGYCRLSIGALGWRTSTEFGG